ncbi:MAG: response regulator transcription factor [Anaerolineae bacterium]|nr:response regulator transcription factor [Anaerolineae bacterium]
MAYILVVDDERDVLTSIAQVLADDGYQVSAVESGFAALNAMEQQLPDLLVLDIIMPEIDGIEVCRRVRANPFTAKVPIIFLTAKGRASDIAEGLDAGADDYLMKPFDVVELPARIRAALRRAPGGTLDPESEYITIGRMKLHTQRPEVKINDDQITLTPTEYRLLHYLMCRIGQPASVEQLLEDVWEYPRGVGDPKLVRVHITNLRNKLELERESPEYIHNLHGRGYLIYNGAKSQ